MVKVWPLEDWGPLRGASVMNFNVKAKRLRSSSERSPGQRHLNKRVLSVHRNAQKMELLVLFFTVST